jgi:protein-S-isoprenylcysteine O-methyltransferase Ste14
VDTTGEPGTLASGELKARRRRAALGTVLFTLAVPGTVVVLVPYLLSGWRLAAGWAPRLAGLLLIAAALPVFSAFLWRFVREGVGTPAPIAPTERLVVGGPFQRVRNPGYVSVVAMVLGQALAFSSWAVAAWGLAIAIGFHLFVVLYEEPTLRRQFGAEYEDYCKRVPRWWPRLGRLLLLALPLCAALACATTRIETQWQEPGLAAGQLAFRRVIALAQVDDETTRRVAEDELARVIASGPGAQARGMQAEPAYRTIPSAELGDVAALRAKVEAAGYDGAVVLRLVSDQERVTYVPGHYEVMWGAAVRYEPGYTDVDRIVRIETTLYSIREGKPLWSGVSRTLNPRDVRKLVDDVVRAVGQELQAQGLAP